MLVILPGVMDVSWCRPPGLGYSKVDTAILRKYVFELSQIRFFSQKTYFAFFINILSCLEQMLYGMSSLKFMVTGKYFKIYKLLLIISQCWLNLYIRNNNNNK